MDKSMALTLTWEGRTVRMVGTSEAPEWVAADVCAVLGLSGTHPWQRIPSGEKGSTLTATPGGTQSLVTVKLPGLLRLILRSDKPEAKRFQSWTVGEVLPSVLKHGCYPPPKARGGVDHLAIAEAMIAELRAQQARLETVEADVAEIKTARAEAEQAMLALPAATVDAPDKTLRSALNEVIRGEGMRRGGEYQSVWRDLYREVLYRCHCDAKARAKNAGTAPLDEIESAGLLPQAYSIACSLWVEPTRKA